MKGEIDERRENAAFVGVLTMRRILRALCFMSLFVLVSAAQQPQRGTTPASAASPQTQTPPPIRVTTQLVVEEVTVKDKSGKPIEGLTAE